MKLFISGGTGFMGKRLTGYMPDMGHEVTCSGRSPHMKMDHENLHYISADEKTIPLETVLNNQS